MSDTRAWEGTYYGERTVWLQSGNYVAVLLPNIGGNMVAFRDTARGFCFLREPLEAEMAAFKARPLNHCIPVLFPPNRYEDGKFPWEETMIQLPVNETARGNHLHGFLYNVPWAVESYGSTASESSVTISVCVDVNHPVYAHFPVQIHV